MKLRSQKRRLFLKNSLHLKTDMDQNCEWIGMGIGWDGWATKRSE